MRRSRDIVISNLEQLLRQSNGLTWKELAERSGVGGRTLSHLRGPDPTKTVRLETLDKIAAFFRIETHQLLRPLQSGDPGIPAPGYVRFEHLDVQASAGAGAAPQDNPAVLQRVDLLESWAYRTLGSRDPDRIKIIEVRGESMAPKINDGDIAFVDVHVNRFDGDGIYVLVWNGRLLIKRLRAQLDGSLSVESENRSYSPEVIQEDNVDSLRIAGRVVRWWGWHQA